MDSSFAALRHHNQVNPEPTALNRQSLEGVQRIAALLAMAPNRRVMGGHLSLEGVHPSQHRAGRHRGQTRRMAATVKSAAEFEYVTAQDSLNWFTGNGPMSRVVSAATTVTES